MNTGTDRQKSSSTSVSESGQLPQACVETMRSGLNPSSPVFLPRYSNPSILGQSYLKWLEKWPTIFRDVVERLDDFTTFLISCQNAMTVMENIKELDYPTGLSLILRKLPTYLQDRWVCVADKVLYLEGLSFLYLEGLSFLS